jgi:hypothetical protein
VLEEVLEREVLRKRSKKERKKKKENNVQKLESRRKQKES